MELVLGITVVLAFFGWLAHLAHKQRMAEIMAGYEYDEGFGPDDEADLEEGGDPTDYDPDFNKEYVGPHGDDNEHGNPVG